jgi:hypothetical protein
VVWSGISVRIPDQTAHLDRTYDSISITTDDIDAITTNPEGHPRTSEPKGLSWPPQLRRKGVEGGAGATRGRFPLYCGPARRYARPRPPLPRPVPPPRSNWLGPRTRATRVAPTVQSWRSTVMLSYSRTEGFGGSDGRRPRERVRRALEGVWAQDDSQDLPASIGLQSASKKPTTEMRDMGFTAARRLRYARPSSARHCHDRRASVWPPPMSGTPDRQGKLRSKGRGWGQRVGLPGARKAGQAFSIMAS